jgi:hypothetical protein
VDAPYKRAPAIAINTDSEGINRVDRRTHGKTEHNRSKQLSQVKRELYRVNTVIQGIDR